MKNKLIGIFIMTLLIATTIPAVGTMNNKTVDLIPSLKVKSVSTDIVWSDNFDSYTLGQYLEGTPDDGGWEAFVSETLGAYVVNDQFRSAPHSVEIFRSADIVHNFSGICSGSWTFIGWVYVPADYNGGSCIFFLSYYNFNPRNYYTQLGIIFDGDNGLVKDYQTGENLTLITDQWVEIRVEIDLEADWFECYYNDELLIADLWTDGWGFHGDGNGFLNLGGVDLCWGSSPIYHDDLSLEGEAIGPVPALNCDGSINRARVKPGSTVKGSFTVENIGEPNSHLEWIVDEYPEWGSNWKFQPKFGRLTPEDDPMIVDVEFKASNEENEEFTGVIKVVAVGDPDDYYEIQITIKTQRNRAINIPFLNFLQSHPNMFPILQLLLQRLGLQ